MRVELEEALNVISRLRNEGARVHSITNTVAQNFTANVLLACGATPSMTVNPDEAEAFTKRADSLHINLGTLDNHRMKAIRTCSELAVELNKPVLLDPVMSNVSDLRAEFAREIVNRTDIIRGNAEEISNLGLDKNPLRCVIQTGAEDLVSAGNITIKVLNGDPMMAKVIATGCALGALISALSTKTENHSIAGIAGLVWFGIAGEIAAEKSEGPGSFAPAFIDCLYHIENETLKERAKII